MKSITLKIASGISMLLGLVILGAVLFPIFSYDPKYSDIDKYLSPVPEGDKFSFKESPDLTKASNWFVGGAEPEDFETSKITYYTISIPKLGIKDAVTAIGGENLSESLIHYPGTALPGKRGNAVIFGHSSLPILFSPTNYDTIFSTLPTLELGDEVIAKYDGVTYRYIIEDMFEVLPTDLEVLAQDTSDSFISLITCVPPGHPLRPRRLIVRARLTP